MHIDQFVVMSNFEIGLMHDMVDRLINGQGTVLEIGYGLGLSAQAIRKKGNPHYILELNRSLALEAKRNGFNVIQTDYREFETQTPFDFIFCDAFVFDGPTTLGREFLQYCRKFIHSESRVTWYGADEGNELESVARTVFSRVEVFRHSVWSFPICRL